VEFIADPDGRFFFMEMNTRLQVEHPVTEMITGHDLVEWQLHVAAGAPLPASQESLAINGHAIEARIYAENPDGGFLPATGRLTHLAQPAAVEFGGQDRSPPAPVRIDSGVRAGDSITPHYDPMIAKLIVWGTDRAHALARLQAALADFHIVGVANNVDFLSRLVANPAFAQAELDTGLIERERSRLFPAGDDERVPDELLAFACARILVDEGAGAGADPWSSAHGWRLNTNYMRTLTLKSSGGVHEVEIEYARDGYVLHHAGSRAPLAISAVDGTRLGIRFGGGTRVADVVRSGDELHVFTGGRHRMLSRVDIIAQSSDGDAATGRLTAPMPGRVIAIAATAGARVERGAPLLVMEAMKMEHTIVAPADGVVADVLFGVGDQVEEGVELVRFEPA
jgi:3-methylcrotonyl-CoA carboxylase alpha subunit